MGEHCLSRFNLIHLWENQQNNTAGKLMIWGIWICIVNDKECWNEITELLLLGLSFILDQKIIPISFLQVTGFYRIVKHLGPNN